MNKLEAVEKKIRELVPRLKKFSSGHPITALDVLEVIEIVGQNEVQAAGRMVGLGPVFALDGYGRFLQFQDESQQDWVVVMSPERTPVAFIPSVPFSKQTALINWLYELFNLSE